MDMALIRVSRLFGMIYVFILYKLSFILSLLKYIPFFAHSRGTSVIIFQFHGAKIGS